MLVCFIGLKLCKTNPFIKFMHIIFYICNHVRMIAVSNCWARSSMLNDLTEESKQNVACWWCRKDEQEDKY